MRQQINFKVEIHVFEQFSNVARGQKLSQRQLFEDMLSIYIERHPESEEKGRRINEMEKQIRGEA